MTYGRKACAHLLEAHKGSTEIQIGCQRRVPEGALRRTAGRGKSSVSLGGRLTQIDYAAQCSHVDVIQGDAELLLRFVN